MKELMDLITIKHYEGQDSQRNADDNWEVFFGGHKIGQLHNYNGIGGELGEFTETEVFDFASGLCEIDLQKRKDGIVDQLETKVFDLISFLDLHGDKTTEAMYSVLDNYIKSSKSE